MSAEKLGINRAIVVPMAFCLAGLLTGVGGLVIAAEVGVGSATVGANYTLLSITAAVLGGASIAGGWGSFICTLLGALLVQVTSSAAAFLDMGAEWQQWMIGVTMLVAAVLYRTVRRR